MSSRKREDDETLRRVAQIAPEILDSDPAHPFDRITEAILDAHPEAVLEHQNTRRKRGILRKVKPRKNKK
jgi:hypothetical protein